MRAEGELKRKCALLSGQGNDCDNRSVMSCPCVTSYECLSASSFSHPPPSHPPRLLFPRPQGGAAMYVENSFKGRNVNGPIMLAMHPHGIMPHSFLLNGAGRIHAQKPETFLPPHYQDMSLKSTGVAEPLLFRIPFISAFLYFFGCAEPASKEMMHDILGRQVPFGILVRA